MPIIRAAYAISGRSFDRLHHRLCDVRVPVIKPINKENKKRRMRKKEKSIAGFTRCINSIAYPFDLVSSFLDVFQHPFVSSFSFIFSHLPSSPCIPYPFSTSYHTEALLLSSMQHFIYEIRRTD